MAGSDETTLRSGPAGEKKHVHGAFTGEYPAFWLGARPLKTQQKISGRLASDAVTQDRLDTRSYTGTARKHGRNAMDALHDLMPGRPWRPPAPACSP